MSELQRGTPPPACNGKGHDWPEIIKDLKSTPGAWGSVVCSTSGSARSMAYQIRGGRYSPFRGHGRFAARSRCADGVPRLWLRYLGDTP